MQLTLAAARPFIRPCAVERNLEACLELAVRADEEQADIVVFPQQTLVGATAGQLAHLPDLIRAAKKARTEFFRRTRKLRPLFILDEHDRDVMFNGLRIAIRNGTGPFPAEADLLLNPCAEPETVGALQRRRKRFAAFRGIAVYSGAGAGESTTDQVYAGDTLITRGGKVVIQGPRFDFSGQLTLADIDTDASVLPRGRSPLPDPCDEALAIQSTGLATRLLHTGCTQVVLGLSGGLDSTLALLVTLEAFAKLGLDQTGIHCLTLPGFGTTSRTRGNAEKLCDALALPIVCIDITRACKGHLRDIGHDGKTPDNVFENAQARERTQILMDYANRFNGIVIGTGDLSESALGWCTYNGDHMCMYNVNAGVTKTFIRKAVARYAEFRAEPAAAAVLKDILDTPISPELLPPCAEGNILQRTETILGPYELHDFFIDAFLLRKLPGAKIVAEARKTFGRSYSVGEIKRYYEIFIRRFVSQQFKRSCSPDGPQVFDVSLSPRCGFQMPSDADGSVFQL